MTQQPTLLPLLSTGPHGSRSHMTCQFRCGNACSKPIPNETDNPEFHEVAAQALARRSVLKAAGAGVGALAIGALTASPAAAAAPAASARRYGGNAVGTADFSPVPPNIKDRVTVPKGYRSEVLIKWGDPVTRKARPFDVDRQTAESAATQFGYNNDYVGIIPTGETACAAGGQPRVHQREPDVPHRRLRLGHDQADRDGLPRHGSRGDHAREPQGFVDDRRPPPREAEQAHHRPDSMFHMSGPAAGDPRLRTSADPSGRRVRGTLNNCAGG